MENKVLKEQKKIGAFITELRDLRGLTQKEFARELKTSQSAVARMENGLQNFSTEMLAKISKVLNREIITLADHSVSFKIEGGYRLSGEVATKSSKNAVVALLCASLLNAGRTRLKNVPKIEEVFRVIEVLGSIGVSVRWRGSDVEIVPPKKLSLEKIDKEAAAKTRSVLMLLGPLVHCLKSFDLPLAGGCKLGRRTVRPHLYALEKLGVGIKTTHDHYKVSVERLKAASEIVLYETGDTVTENAIMAASRINGITTIKLASANYMVQDLCYFLQNLGIRIEGIGSSTLVVHGKPKIKKNISFFIQFSDF